MKKPICTSASTGKQAEVCLKTFDRTALLLSALVLFLIPFVLSVLRRDWLFTNPFILPWFDPYVYLGYFLRFPEYVAANPGYYPGERLAVIIPGYILFHLFEPGIASVCLRFALWLVSVFSLYFALLRLSSMRAAVVTAVILGLHPPFLSAAGWDYIDGFANAYHLLALACASQLSVLKYRKYALFILGILLACMFLCSTFMMVYIPPVVIFAIWQLTPIRFTELTRLTVIVVAGGVATVVACSLVNVVAGGTWFIFGSQYNTMVHMLSGNEPLVDPSAWQPILWYAPWAALPFVMAVTALPNFFRSVAYLSRWRSLPRETQLKWLVSLFCIYQFGLYLFLQFTSFAALSFFMYSSLLIPLCVLALGVRIGDALSSLSLSGFLALLGILVTLSLWTMNASVGKAILESMALSFGRTYTIIPVVGFAAAMLSFVTLKPSWGQLISGVFLLVFAQVTTCNTSQLNHFWHERRANGVRAIVEGINFFQSKNLDGQLGIWMNTKDSPFGDSIFWASWIANHVRSGPFRSTELPAFDEKAVKEGLQVMTFTNDEKIAPRIREPLQEKGYTFELLEKRHILHPRVDFWMHHIKLQKIRNAG